MANKSEIMLANNQIAVMVSDMNHAQHAENQDSARLRKSEEAINYYRQKEAEALRELAIIRASLKSSREKHEALFAECQKRACDRRDAGLIVNTVGY